MQKLPAILLFALTACGVHQIHEKEVSDDYLGCSSSDECGDDGLCVPDAGFGKGVCVEICPSGNHSECSEFNMGAQCHEIDDIPYCLLFVDGGDQ